MKISKSNEDNMLILGVIALIITTVYIVKSCKHYKINEDIQLCGLALLMILWILFYKLCLYIFEVIEKRDPLLRNVHEYIPVDRWIFSHFMVFMIAGAVYPKQGLKLFGIGVIWEIIEVILGYIYNNKSDFTWWYGSYKDPIANGLGILVGIYVLRPIYDKMV